ncbi:stage II sporulation protein M [Ferroplasma sp.]|uniref:stage II sporulation protein M n=1 Tax=Ferroplasma sp. TaxID=2591003 RepID=UPI00307FAF07
MTLKMPKLRRIFLISFLVELIGFAVISSLPIHDLALYRSFKSTDSAIVSQPFFPMWLSIFPHNLEIASIEFIPVVGILMFGFSIGATASVIAIEGTATNINGFAIFASLMLLPHSWLELPAYAVAASTSIYILYYLITKKLKANYMKIVYMYLFVVIELAFAGAIETSEILLEESPHPFYAFYMWIPAIPIIIFLIWLYRHLDANEYKPKKEKEYDEYDFNQF